jgi:hypothetical protein
MNRSALQIFIILSASFLGHAARSTDHFMQSPLESVEHSLLGLKDVPKEKEETSGGNKGPTPMFTTQTMPKVSPAVQCVINLSIQFFVVYTMLAFMRTFNQFTGNSMLGMQKILETACTTVTYAPMLAVLFIGVRMRAIQLTQGETEKYKLPQPWVQQAMYVCSFAVLAQVIMVILMPIFTGEAEVKCDEEGNLDQSALHGAGVCGVIVSVFRYLIMLALYGGMITVVVGAFLMEGPKDIWGKEGAPPVSPAVACTMNLTAQFFIIYFLVAIIKTVTEFLGPSDFLIKLQGLLTLAKYTVNFAPMLCILFVGARMRALQMDPMHGAPQWWAQYCFYLCTYSVMVQAIMIILIPLCLSCECKQGASEGDVVFIFENECMNGFMTLIRYVALLALYGGFTAVIVSVFIIEHPTDVSMTPPVSPAMKCVMNLTVQYFFIYLMLFVCISLKQCMGNIPCLTTAIFVFEAGQKTVMFAPMLSILFIATRMRALQLAKATDGTIPPEAGPPGYAQDAMFLCTWAVLVQVCMALLVCLLTCGGRPQMDEDGNVKKPEGGNFIVGIILDIIKYLSMIAMYGGIVTIIVAIFLMTPETLPPYAERGSLIPGAPVEDPPTPPTPKF